MSDAAADGLAKYNRIYEHLVESDDDVIGLVAYAIYKQDKRDWLIGWRDEHGTDPTPEQFEAFISSKRTSGQRDRYRAAARTFLDAYALVAVEAERPRIVEDAVTERIETAAVTVEQAGRWWRQIPSGIASAFIYTLILIGIVLLLRYAGIDLVGILDRAPPAP